jgi:hypothetical protein
MHDKAHPQHPAVSEHVKEQPDGAHRTGLVDELAAELGEVDLPSTRWRGLEPMLEAGRPGRTGIVQKVV